MNDRVRDIVARVTGRPTSEIHDDLDLVDSGLIDSMLALRIVTLLERAFDVRIPEEDLGDYLSVRSIVEGIEGLRKADGR